PGRSLLQEGAAAAVVLVADRKLDRGREDLVAHAVAALFARDPQGDRAAVVGLPGVALAVGQGLGLRNQQPAFAHVQVQFDPGFGTAVDFQRPERFGAKAAEFHPALARLVPGRAFFGGLAVVALTAEGEGGAVALVPELVAVRVGVARARGGHGLRQDDAAGVDGEDQFAVGVVELGAGEQIAAAEVGGDRFGKCWGWRGSVGRGGVGRNGVGRVGRLAGGAEEEGEAREGAALVYSRRAGKAIARLRGSERSSVWACLLCAR